MLCAWGFTTSWFQFSPHKQFSLAKNERERSESIIESSLPLFLQHTMKIVNRETVVSVCDGVWKEVIVSHASVIHFSPFLSMPFWNCFSTHNNESLNHICCTSDRLTSHFWPVLFSWFRQKQELHSWMWNQSGGKGERDENHKNSGVRRNKTVETNPLQFLKVERAKLVAWYVWSFLRRWKATDLYVIRSKRYSGCVLHTSMHVARILVLKWW